MSILGSVLGAKLAYIIEHGQDPTCVLLHPISIAQASIEAWEKEEDEGRYGMPDTKLEAIHELTVITDWKADEGEVWVGTNADYEALCAGRIAAWRAVNGLPDGMEA